MKMRLHYDYLHCFYYAFVCVLEYLFYCISMGYLSDKLGEINSFHRANLGEFLIQISLHLTLKQGQMYFNIDRYDEREIKKKYKSVGLHEIFVFNSCPLNEVNTVTSLKKI